MQGEWTHAICDDCWPRWCKKRAREVGEPARILVAPQLETCCYCGHWTTGGIYVRDDPKVPWHCEEVKA